MAALIAVAAALLFGATVPLAKTLLAHLPPVALAGLLYLGCGIGLLAIVAVRRLLGVPIRFARAHVPAFLGSLVSGGIVAPLLFVRGLADTTAGDAALLLNLETVFTVVLARVMLREPFGARVYGPRMALATLTQAYGNALGVSVVGGVVYAESDDQFAYAVNARTGRLIWRTSPVGNSLMGDPLVAGSIVYVAAGSVGFNFANVQRYAHKTAARGAGISFNGIYALDKTNGRLLWHFGTMGATMPTPAIAKGRLFFTTGSGDIYAINATSGRKLWIQRTGGVANMSDPAVYHGHVYVAMALVPYVYCLSATTGHVIWRATIPHTTKPGFGDVPPAVAHGVVVMDAVGTIRSHGGHTTMTTIIRAYNAADGRVLWSHTMGRGPKPPAFKGGVPMIHKDVVYVGSPVNNVYQAYSLHTGRLLWTWHIPKAGPAGAGRGPATYAHGRLFIAAGARVFALDPHTGRVIGERYLGGRFGIVDPVIVGGTLYLANSWDWLMALPVSQVLHHTPHHR